LGDCTGGYFEVGGSEEVSVDEVYGMGWRIELYPRVWTFGLCGWLSVYPLVVLRYLFCDNCFSFLAFSLSCFIEKILVSQLQLNGYVETHLKKIALSLVQGDNVNKRKRFLQPDAVRLHRAIAVLLAPFG